MTDSNDAQAVARAQAAVMAAVVAAEVTLSRVRVQTRDTIRRLRVRR